MRTNILGVMCMIMILNSGCNGSGDSGKKSEGQRSDSTISSFQKDFSFLKKYDTSLIELTAMNGDARILISPKFQGKVFTSTAEGENGRSFGWINYGTFDKQPNNHMNAFGGEDRLWLGPEGGPFSLFFAPGTEMVFDNWHTPPAFDIEPWSLISSSSTEAVLSKDMLLKNYAGMDLKININRKIDIFNSADIEKMLSVTLGKSIKSVGFTTLNTLSNSGNFDWNKKTGAPCMWNLDMFTPSPKTVIVIPYNLNTEGKIATTDYFGQIPADRIKMDNGVLYFKADGKSRGKLGLPANRSLKISGSYASDEGVLTITFYDIDSTQTYLNQEWTTKKDPFTGDAANAYNDGPLQDGTQMGPFYEIESVSPAAFLKPGQSIIHHHSVFHFTGNKEDLNALSEKLFGTSLDKIEQVFNKN